VLHNLFCIVEQWHIHDIFLPSDTQTNSNVILYFVWVCIRVEEGARLANSRLCATQTLCCYFDRPPPASVSFLFLLKGFFPLSPFLFLFFFQRLVIVSVGDVLYGALGITGPISGGPFNARNSHSQAGVNWHQPQIQRLKRRSHSHIRLTLCLKKSLKAAVVIAMAPANAASPF
jgi:hypothetical protein